MANRPFIFDNASGGHHLGFISRVTKAVLDSEHPAFLASQVEPSDLVNHSELAWLPVEGFGVRQVRRGRSIVGSAAAAATEWGATSFWDLDLDQNVWVSSRKTRSFDRRLHVLHRGHQYLYQERSSFGRARTALLRVALPKMLGADATVVVHTRIAHEILSEVLPANRIARIGYPVVNRGWRLHEPPSTGRPEPRVLFVGGAKREKGLDLLLRAMAQSGLGIGVEVVGRQPPGIKDDLVRRFRDVEVLWRDRFVSEEELAEAYRNSLLVATPYRPNFGRVGGASGVVLEAMAHGVPLVTTDATADQLPASYGGAVVVSGDSGDGLTDGLLMAVDRIEDLRRDARRHGPAFVAEHHSAEGYVERLLEATS